MKVARTKHYKITKNHYGNCVELKLSIDVNNFSLFRYRPINKHTVEQFINDDLFASCTSAFNDPYDATVKFSPKGIKKHIKDRLEKNPDLLEKLLIDSDLKNNQVNKLIDLLFTNVLSPTTKFDNNVYVLACFSTEISEEIMWAHYANLATGFALEYDYNDLCDLSIKHQEIANNLVRQFDFLKDFIDEIEIIKHPLLPVIYTNEKYDASDIYNEIIDFFLDKISKGEQPNSFNIIFDLFEKDHSMDKVNMYMQNIYCRKKKPWSYENEWRLIGYNTNAFLGLVNDNYVNIGKIIPKAIYLGEKISEYDKMALLNIAQEKGIDVYIMHTVIVGNTLKLKPRKISL